GYTFRMSWHATQLVGAKAHLWGFDSFAGLPTGSDERDSHPQWVAGTMATPELDFHRLCRRAGMAPKDYDVVAGFYQDTLRPGARGPRPSAVALAYIDCDLYSSTIDVLGYLDPVLIPGSIIGFDDYFCYNPNGPSGEKRAAVEHFSPQGSSRWRLVPYVQFGWAGMSFVVERNEDPIIGPGSHPGGQGEPEPDQY
ncbi:MAG: TylF/MycF/NovP-related O-methyltransferase, partial [Acidimicrobiales bacterium]